MNQDPWVDKAQDACSFLMSALRRADRPATAMKYLADAKDALTEAISYLDEQLQRED